MVYSSRSATGGQLPVKLRNYCSAAQTRTTMRLACFAEKTRGSICHRTMHSNRLAVAVGPDLRSTWRSSNVLPFPIDTKRPHRTPARQHPLLLTSAHRTSHCSSDASIVDHHPRERPANPVLSWDGDVEQSDGERQRGALASAAPAPRPSAAPAAAAGAAAAPAGARRSSGRGRRPLPERPRAHDLRSKRRASSSGSPDSSPLNAKRTRSSCSSSTCFGFANFPPRRIYFTAVGDT